MRRILALIYDGGKWCRAEKCTEEKHDSKNRKNLLMEAL
jgi:hypothetical protein